MVYDPRLGYDPSDPGAAPPFASGQPNSPAATNMPFPGQVDPNGLFAPRPRVAAPAPRRAVGPMAGYNVGGVFNNLSDSDFTGGDFPGGGANAVQRAQAPVPATPQGWNLFAALGQALGHLVGYNAAGQPQGMTGLIRNPAAPTTTATLRMPGNNIASRYQGRTFLG